MKKRIVATILSITAMMTVTDVAGFAGGLTPVSAIMPASGVALVLEEGVDPEEVYLEQKGILGTLSGASVSGENTEDNTESANVTTGEVLETISEDASKDTAVEFDPSGNESVISQVEKPEDGVVVLDLNGNTESAVLETVQMATEVVEEVKEAQAEEEAKDPEHFSNLVIATCDSYVRVRETPDTEGEVVGKLYDKSVGTFIEEEDGWYKINSGKVTGYVSAEYCITGEAAIEKAKEVGTRFAEVNTTTLKVRSDASTEATVLTLVPVGDDLVVTEELDGWVKVICEEGEGYVSTDYVILHTEFVQAESKEEEEARLAKEEAEREAAKKAAEKAIAAKKAQKESSKKNTANTETQQAAASKGSTYTVPAISGSGLGTEVAQYGCQFVGNPYVYGGSSLTNGTDCSGFVMSVYNAFGVSLPHSSKADRSVGYAVEGGIANAQPGDIVCYSGHVAIYIGNGQIVHASNARTGIIVGNANYSNILAVRRIF